MSSSPAAPARFLDCDAFVTGVAYGQGLAAFALGDGTVKLVPDDVAERVVEAHDGTALCIAAMGNGFVTGGDDGRLVLTGADGSTEVLASTRGKWIENVAVHAASGAVAFTAGKEVRVIVKPGAEPKVFTHNSTVSGIAFDPKGKRIAASRYNGVSLWWLNADKATPTELEWKGSHTGVWWHPNGDFIMTAMLENALHGWRLPDKAHMRMAGYPAKTRSMAFFNKGKWLATSGSESVVCWPFDGKGPMGKSAREAGPQGSICTVVAAHPDRDLLASGHADGSIWLTRFEDDKTTCVRAPAEMPVSAIAWRPDGYRLAFGCEDGASGVLNFEPARPA